jgi:hypothetical protein
MAVVPVLSGGNLFEVQASGGGDFQQVTQALPTSTWTYGNGTVEDTHNYIALMFLLGGTIGGNPNNPGDIPPYFSSISATFSGFNCIVKWSEGNHLPGYTHNQFLSVDILCIVPYGASYSGNTLSVTFGGLQNNPNNVNWNAAEAARCRNVDPANNLTPITQVGNANTTTPYTLIESNPLANTGDLIVFTDWGFINPGVNFSGFSGYNNESYTTISQNTPRGVQWKLATTTPEIDTETWQFSPPTNANDYTTATAFVLYAIGSRGGRRRWFWVLE